MNNEPLVAVATSAHRSRHARRRACLSLSGALLFGAAWPAAAAPVQQADVTGADQAASPPTVGSQATVDSNPADDIVVTAQRTSSVASRTPVALSAIGGEALRESSVTNPTNLGELVPNLNISRGANNGLQITIRGVTSFDGSEKGDPSAAFLLDGIYIARPQVQETSFFDIARVEVLRGPQGTLYGRNTTAGVVNVITNRPVHRFEANANIGYGNFDTLQADAMINVPVTDWLAVRASGSFDRRDSYLRPSAGEQFRFDPFKKNVSGRLQALVDVSPDIHLVVIGDYSSLKGNPLIWTLGRRLFNTQDAQNPIRLPSTSEERRTLGYTTRRQGGLDNETWGITGELTWGLGPVEMTYLGSYREFTRDEQFTDVGGSVPASATYTGTYRQNSQELRFATTGEGPLKLQAGGYYFHEKSGVRFFLENALPGVPFFGFPQDPTINKTYAFFGQGTYSLTSALRVTLGARYSHDQKSRIGATVRQQTPVFDAATDTALLNFADVSFSKTTYRVGLEYDLSSRTLLYGTFSTGYKAGGFNDGCEAGTSVNGITCNQVRPLDVLYYQPETLNSYEVGLKTRLFDNMVRFNASAFHYDYKNLQLTQVVTLNGGPSSQTSNAARARISGVELEAVLQPSKRNRVDLAFTYLDAEYADYLPLGASNPNINYRGRSLDRSPKLVATTGYTYTLPIEDGDLTLGARTRLSDSYTLTAFSVPAQYVQPSFTQTDVRATYHAPGDRWYAEVFGKNLEDNVVFTATNARGYMTVGDPRTYGVRTGVRF